MGEKIDLNKEAPSWQDIVYSNMIETEALVQIMLEKGLMTREEFDNRVEKLHKAFLKKQQSEGNQGET